MYKELILTVIYIVIGVLSVFFVAIKNCILRLCIPTAIRHKDIKTKTVLITGGASGLGRQLAVSLARKGAKIISWDINESDNEETAKIITEDYGGQCFPYTVDISNKEVVQNFAKLVKKHHDFVDIVINNAGMVGFISDISSYPQDTTYDKTIKVNTLSHIWITKEFLDDMMSKNKGHIVSISSIFAEVPLPMVDYVMSKAAVCGFIKSLRMQLDIDGYFGIKTTLVCPWFIDTPFLHCVDYHKKIPKLSLEAATTGVMDAVLLEEELSYVPKIAGIVPFFLSFAQSSVIRWCSVKINRVINKRIEKDL